MPQVTRKNPNALATISTRLKELDGREARAGWFKTSHYADGTPVAYIACVMEYGAHINHPGGTPYKMGPNGAIFVSKAAGAGLPVTKPHAIVIPPRPFMRPTVTRERQNWLNLMTSGAKAVLAGNETGYSVMDKIGQRAAADIAVSIRNVTEPPLKPGTIAARKRRHADQTTLGLLDKPLEDSGKMFEEVTHVTLDTYGSS